MINLTVTNCAYQIVIQSCHFSIAIRPDIITLFTSRKLGLPKYEMREATTKTCRLGEPADLA